MKISDPLIVVEVVSRGSKGQDCEEKLEGYFRLPSVRHYLVVKTRNETVIHHARNELGEITTQIIRRGPITLDPTGIIVSEFFPSP